MRVRSQGMPPKGRSKKAATDRAFWARSMNRSEGFHRIPKQRLFPLWVLGASSIQWHSVELLLRWGLSLWWSIAVPVVSYEVVVVGPSLVAKSPSFWIPKIRLVAIFWRSCWPMIMCSTLVPPIFGSNRENRFQIRDPDPGRSRTLAALRLILLHPGLDDSSRRGPARGPKSSKKGLSSWLESGSDYSKSWLATCNPKDNFGPLSLWHARGLAPIWIWRSLVHCFFFPKQCVHTQGFLRSE